MQRSTLVSAIVSLPLLFATTAQAAEYGTAKEARAMLDSAVAELKADEAGALAKFNSSEGGFRDGDLYVFCFDSRNFTTTAHPSMVGQDVRSLKDESGKFFGEEMHRTAKEGEVSEISYMWPRPGSTEPVQKKSYFTKVGQQVCGVGYYP